MEVNIVKFFQKASCSFLDGLNTVITVIGETSMLFMLFITIYLCYKKDFAVKYLFFFMLSGLVNGAIKGTVKRARPYTHEGVLDVRHTTGYSFPSGHSQNYALQATLIGTEFCKNNKSAKKRAGIIVPLIIVGLLVAISRMYLGQHFLTDVLVGLTLGFILALGFEVLFNLIPKKVKKVLNVQTVLIILIHFALLLVVLIEYLNLGSESMLNMFYTYLAIYMGLLVGYSVDSAFINYEEKAVWWVQIFKILIAGVGVLLLSLAFKWIENEVVRNFLFYLTSTLYVTLLLPLLFKTILKNKGLKKVSGLEIENETTKTNNAETLDESEAIEEEMLKVVDNKSKKSKTKKKTEANKNEDELVVEVIDEEDKK